MLMLMLAIIAGASGASLTVMFETYVLFSSLFLKSLSWCIPSSEREI
jgi:hypothetical protein